MSETKDVNFRSACYLIIQSKRQRGQNLTPDSAFLLQQRACFGKCAQRRRRILSGLQQGERHFRRIIVLIIAQRDGEIIPGEGGPDDIHLDAPFTTISQA